MTATHSPASRCNETPSTATTSPRTRRTSSSSTSAPAPAPLAFIRGAIYPQGWALRSVMGPMHKTTLALLMAAAGLVAAPSLASASGVAYPTADWTEASITEADGTVLHADVLHPKGFKNTDKTPVIISIGPYFNHSGQTSAAGPVEGTSYDPVGPNDGPSERFQDFVEGAKLFTRDGVKYTFVMV